MQLRDLDCREVAVELPSQIQQLFLPYVGNMKSGIVMQKDDTISQELSRFCLILALSLIWLSGSILHLFWHRMVGTH